MSFNKIKIAFLIVAPLVIFACKNEDPTPPSLPAEVAVNRLIFTGTADTGGEVKIELNDSKLESLLDGNPHYNGLVLQNYPQLPCRESLISINITDLNYYGDVVTINCAQTSGNKISLEWKSQAGSLYQNTDGAMYVLDLGMPPYYYLEQLADEDIIEAAIPVSTTPEDYFSMTCTGSDGNDYRLSFYGRTSPESHGITTTFSVVNGTVEGIIKVHRIGDGYQADMDILL